MASQRFIDCHCHLASPEFKDDLDDVITRAQTAGVEAAVVVTESANDFTRALELGAQYPGWVLPCLGLHPVQEKRSVTVDDWKVAQPFIEQHTSSIVGIGEIGLDFTPWVCKTATARENQELVFRAQIQLAKRLALPVNVHSRSAAKRVLEILIEEGADKVLLHNFAGKPALALLAHKHGYFMSFPPIVATKPERSKLICRVPLDVLCLETDSPALGCDPQIRNEPAAIVKSCSHVAKLKCNTEEHICDITLANARRLFNLNINDTTLNI